MGHYVKNTGTGPLRFLEMFKSSYCVDLSLGTWMALTPPKLVQAHLKLDQQVMDALRKRSIESVAALGESTFQAGTSEIKNWVPVAGAMADLGYEPTVVDYVPCYRSLAGTGNAMGFVYWR